MPLKTRYPVAPAPAIPRAAAPVSPLQRRADRSAYVRQLTALQDAATHSGGAQVLQLYSKETLKGQDGHFVPKMTAAIHCHVGKKMRSPHLKIGGLRFNFGSEYELSRMQAAYNALVGDPSNAALEGYADCVEYLEEEGCDPDAVPVTHTGRAATGPLSAYDDPDTSPFSRSLIERGLERGQYPPK